MHPPKKQAAAIKTAAEYPAKEKRFDGITCLRVKWFLSALTEYDYT